MSAETPENEFKFQAEVQRVLSLVINSLYTHSEVFLRELISNSSDALDKARFLRLTDKDEVRPADDEAAIDLRLDKDNHVLVVEDNGVGMTREEVIENLGTIARSGTGEFAEKFAELTAKKEKEDALELIGQFGVGFYAVFMVASRVDVETLSVRNGAEPVLWRSSGDGSYHVLPGERETPGTKITIHLKDDAHEFAEKWRVEQIIRKYSDFVMFPIRVDGEVKNQSSALWRTPPSKVTDEEHAEFYKHLTQGVLGDEPIAKVHYKVDAPVQFSALLYVPDRPPSDMFQLHQKRQGLRLYAKRVLIMEHCESLLPVYLRFVRGVVDSEDLQLNVSRETLQENRTVKTIESQIVKQVLKELGRIADEEPEQYATFWSRFGQVLKEGLSLDFKNKDRLVELLRFETLKNEAGKTISLKEYVEAKGEDQKEIFFLTGQSREQLERSPHLEVFRKKDIDVLLMFDPIDEWVVKSINAYEELPLKSVAHGDLDLDDEVGEEDKETLDIACVVVKRALEGKVDEVRLSSRLTETASCLVSKQGDPGANLERIMKMLDESAIEKKRILELNPTHPIVQNLAKVAKANASSPKIELWSNLLYDQALLSEGVVEDPAQLVKRIQELLVESSGNAAEGV